MCIVTQCALASCLISSTFLGYIDTGPTPGTKVYHPALGARPFGVREDVTNTPFRLASLAMTSVASQRLAAVAPGYCRLAPDAGSRLQPVSSAESACADNMQTIASACADFCRHPWKGIKGAILARKGGTKRRRQETLLGTLQGADICQAVPDRR